ncbi:MAG TPA: YceI family protein [Candidatus Dormibacteraeota bacterium]|jgi:PAS domain S-box-containing protein|nr:YceI family protein [Candidatus Dormibacteraeota bacterium]
MWAPELPGGVLGRYRIEEHLGTGSAGAVYRARRIQDDEVVALRVLDPGLTRRPGFMARFADQAAAIAALAHPHILPVHELGTHGHLSYLSMRLVEGETLRRRLERGPLPPDTARRVASAIADALHRAHQVGVVHQDLKPANVFLGGDGSVLVADFGLARVRYGCATGTPGYLAPEQAQGLEVDPRTDVHALALLVYEMLTGVPAYRGDSPIDLVLAAVERPVPPARSIRPDLPPELDEVLARALAKDPERRHPGVLELLQDLSRVPLGVGSPAGPPPGPGLSPPGAEVAGRGDDLEPVGGPEALPEAMFALDGRGLVTHWDERAEALFGWPRERVMGLAASTTIVAHRHRELLERTLADLCREEGPGTGSVELLAVHRDGHRFPIELRLRRLRPSSGDCRLLASCQDLTERKAAERLSAMREAVDGVRLEDDDPDALRRVVAAIGASLDWPVGVLWRPVHGRLRCEQFWHAPGLEVGELEALTRKASPSKDGSLPGRAWARGAPVWCQDLARSERSDRERAALRAGLRAAGAFPLAERSRTVGVLEFFAAGRASPDPSWLQELTEVGRRLAPTLARGRPRPLPPPAAEAAPAAPERRRYRLDPRRTRLGFSCSFMRFLIVHGRFKNARGWVEIEGDDLSTLRAECRIETESVDTGSADRDHHLRSRDFFATDVFPEMSFRSTRVQARGEDRYRVFGELTIRDVTRPIALEARLEDRTREPSGKERVVVSASALVNRRDWFLDWEEALEAGRWIVGEEVQLELELTLVSESG